MKRYLALAIAMVMIFASLPTAFAADIASVSISSGTLVPGFSADVFKYDIILESEDSQIPEIDFVGNGEIIKEAEYAGDFSVLRAGDGSEYTFTVRTPYETATTKAFSVVAADSTVVQSASANSVYTANRDYVQIVKNYSDTNPATRYILLKFDLTGKDVDLLGKFELNLFKRGTYGDGQTMKVTVGAANVPDDWTYATATYNKTLGKAGSSVEAEKISFDILPGSGAAHSIDISSIVRDRINKGLRKFTLVLDIDLASITNVTSGAQLQVHFYNHVNAKESIRPALSYYPVKKGKDASLKSIEITDGIEDIPFSSDVLNYKIGVPEGKVPAIRFRLSDSHASAEYTPATQIGETATIKVTSHDGTETKTYSFEYVSLSDAGITADGKIEVKSSLYKKGDEVAEDLFSGDQVTYTAQLRNNNLLEKEVVAVTVMKKNGVFKGVSDICEATLSVGNNTLTGAEIEIPSEEGISLETYLFEKDTENNKYIPLTDRMELPVSSYQPQIASATEKIQYRLEGSDIIFYGKAEEGAYIPFVLVKPDCEISDFTASDDSSVAAMGLLKANEDGIWELRTEVAFSNKYYTAYISEGGELYSLPVLHTALEDKLSVLSGVYGDIYNNSDKTSAVSDMKTTLGLADESNINDIILGLDTSSLSEVSETNLLGNIYNVVKELHETLPSVDSEEDIEEFLAIYDYALIISKLNAGISVGATEVMTRFAFDDLAEIYSEVQDFAKSDLDASLIGKGIETKGGMYTLLKDNIILSLINNSQNPDYTMSKVVTYGAYLGLDMAGYSSLQGRQAFLITDLANEGPYATKSALVSKFSELVIRQRNILNSQANQGSFGGGSGGGGGGGSSSGGGSASIAGGTGMTGAGSIPTDDLAVKPAKIFSDVEADNWAYEATAYLAKKNILSGMGDGSFAPTKSVKREEFAKILCLALNLEEKEEIEFADADKSAWYYEYICKAYKSGAILGIGEDNFGTGKSLSRQDIAVIIVRALDLTAEKGEDFSDDADIADYAKDAVYTLKALGVLNGTGEGKFEPNRSVTRAECAKIVYEVIKEME